MFRLIQLTLRRLTASQLRTNVTASAVSTVATAILALLAYPIYLHYLGYQLYGAWLVISSVNAVIQFGSVGLGPAVTKFVAEGVAQNDRDEISDCISTASLIVAGTGALLVLAAIGLAHSIAQLLGLTGDLAEVAERFLPWVAAISAYALIVQVRTAALAGLGRTDQSAGATVVGRFFTLGVGWVLLHFGHELTALVVGQVVGTFSTHFLSNYAAKKRAGIPLILHARWSKREARRLWEFGRSIAGSSLFQMLLQPLNRLLLTRFAGVESVPIFEIAWGSSMQVRGVLAAGLQALLPDFSHASTQGDVKRLRSLTSKSYRLVFLSAPLFVLVAAAAPYLLSIWLRSGYLPAQVPAFRLMIGGAFLSLVGVPGYYLLLGSGKTFSVLFAHGVQSVANVIAALCLILFGLLTSTTMCICTITGIAAATLWLVTSSRSLLRDSASPKSSTQ